MADLEKTHEMEKKEAEKGIMTERTKTGRVYMPNVDIIEDRDALSLVTDVPGASDEDVSITLENDVLTIDAKVTPEDVGSRRAAYAEYGVGDYFRSFTITEAVDRDRIEAKIKDGVLRITLPKAEAAKPKQIKITAG